MSTWREARQAEIERREESIPSRVRSFLARVQARESGGKIMVFGLGKTWTDAGSTPPERLEGIPELEGQNLSDCCWFLDALITQRLQETEDRKRRDNPRYAGMPGVGWM